MTNPQPITAERLHAMQLACAERRGAWPGGCPCIFRHECQVPTPELIARLESERAELALLRQRIGKTRFQWVN